MGMSDPYIAAQKRIDMGLSVYMIDTSLPGEAAMKCRAVMNVPALEMKRAIASAERARLMTLRIEALKAEVAAARNKLRIGS
jgi:hypothetical protein